MKHRQAHQKAKFVQRCFDIDIGSESDHAIKVSPFLKVAKYFGRSLRRNIIYQGVNLLKLRKVISVGADFNAPSRREK